MFVLTIKIHKKELLIKRKYPLDITNHQAIKQAIKQAILPPYLFANLEFISVAKQDCCTDDEEKDDGGDDDGDDDFADSQQAVVG